MPITFLVLCLPKLQGEIVEYIEEYTPYVMYTVKKRRFLERYWDDIIQLIIIELIKMYVKKETYTDFDWVIRSVIRRKAIVYCEYYVRRDKNLVFPDHEGIHNANDNDTVSLENGYDVVKRSSKIYKKSEESIKIIEYVKDLQFRVNNSKYAQFFTDWDREYIEVAIELYELGCELGRSDLIECMGYDESDVTEFNSKLLSFRNRLVKYFGEEFRGI